MDKTTIIIGIAFVIFLVIGLVLIDGFEGLTVIVVEESEYDFDVCEIQGNNDNPNGLIGCKNCYNYNATLKGKRWDICYPISLYNKKHCGC